MVVIFERSESDARRTEEAYRLFAEGFGTTVQDILERRGSVVVYWDKTPNEDEQARLDGCL